MSDQAEAIEALRSRILSIPSDLKALFSIVDDADLSDELRTLGAAAIFYNLNPANLIPAKEGMLGLADDAIAIRCALHDVLRAAPDRAKKHAEGSPETWEGLEHEIVLLQGLLGELWEPLREAWRGVGALEWRGKTAAEAVSDSEASVWLYSAVDEALALRDVDDAAVVREVRREPLLAKLSSRLSVRKRG